MFFSVSHDDVTCDCYITLHHTSLLKFKINKKIKFKFIVYNSDMLKLIKRNYWWPRI